MKKKENLLFTEINKLSKQLSELSTMKKEIADLKHEIKSYKINIPEADADQFYPNQNLYMGNRNEPSTTREYRFLRQSRYKDFRCVDCKQTGNNY